MNAKIMAMMMVGVMMFSGLAIMVDVDENDATTPAGELYAIGLNSSGSLGIGSYSNATIPTSVLLDDPVIQVSADTSTSGSYRADYFLTLNGELFGAGKFSKGQLGNGQTSGNAATPIQIGANLGKFVKVESNTGSSGYGGFVVYLTDNGELFGNGDNSEGQLSTNNTTDQTTPIQIGASIGTIKDMIASPSLLVVLTEDGKVYGSGSNTYGKLATGGTNNPHSLVQVAPSIGSVKSISVNSYNLLMVTENGELFGTGNNSKNQLGISDTSDQYSPIQIGSSLGTIVKAATSTWTVYFLTQDGKLYGLGSGIGGKLGQGDTSDQATPVQIGSSLGTIVDFNCDGNTLIFLTQDGKLYGCGANSERVLATGNNTNQTTPVQIGSSLGTIEKFSFRNNNLLFTNEDKELFITGSNSYGQMGQGDTATYSVPKKIPATGSVQYFTSGTADVFFTTSSTVTFDVNENTYGAVNVESISASAGDTISISSNTLTIGDTTVTATPTADTAQYDYSFSGWYDGATQLVGGETVTGDMTITANFARSLQEYTVTATASSYGSVSPASVTQPYGSAISASGNVLTIGSQTITATPDAADAQYTYTFTGWSTFPSTLTENTSVTANFDRTVNTYTITWSISGSTTSETLSYGEMPSHEDPVPPEGYLFAGWNPEIATVTGDQTYTAVFEEIVYITVTFDPNGGQLEGSATKSVGIGLTYGELPTPKKDNYKFLGWYTDPEEGTLVTADTIVTADADQTLYAHWELTGFAAMLKPLLFLFPLILLAFLAIALVRTFA